MSRPDARPARPGPAPPPFRAELRVRADDPDGWRRLGDTLARWLAQRGGRRVAVVCIGTDRSTGDALGPLVGTLLDRHRPLPREAVELLGTLDEPVHAGNLDQALARLAALGPGTTVLAIDACLGRSENVGTISAGRGALQPGAGVNKSLPAVGHLFVTGTVNVGGFMEYFVLQNTRLGLVLRMAEAIAAGVVWGLRLYLRHSPESDGDRGTAGHPGGLSPDGAPAVGDEGDRGPLKEWAAREGRRPAGARGMDALPAGPRPRALAGAAAATVAAASPSRTEAGRWHRGSGEEDDPGGIGARRTGSALTAPGAPPALCSRTGYAVDDDPAGRGAPWLPESCRLRLGRLWR